MVMRGITILGGAAALVLSVLGYKSCGKTEQETTPQKSSPSIAGYLTPSGRMERNPQLNFPYLEHTGMDDLNVGFVDEAGSKEYKVKFLFRSQEDANAAIQNLNRGKLQLAGGKQAKLYVTIDADRAASFPRPWYHRTGELPRPVWEEDGVILVDDMSFVHFVTREFYEVGSTSATDPTFAVGETPSYYPETREGVKPGQRIGRHKRTEGDITSETLANIDELARRGQRRRIREIEDHLDDTLDTSEERLGDYADGVLGEVEGALDSDE